MSGGVDLEAVLAEHDGLAVSWAVKSRQLGVELDDLIQDARMGLLEAARRFDESHGVRFSTYATYWIRRSIQRGTSRHRWALSLSEEAVLLRRALLRELSAGSEGDERSRLEVVASVLGLDPEVAEMLLGLSRGSDPDPSGSPEGQWIRPQVADGAVEDQVIRALESNWVRQVVGQLPVEEAQVVGLRFGLAGDAPLSRPALQAQHQLSFKRQRLLERQAFGRMRQALGHG